MIVNPGSWIALDDVARTREECAEWGATRRYKEMELEAAKAEELSRMASLYIETTTSTARVPPRGVIYKGETGEKYSKLQQAVVDALPTLPPETKKAVLEALETSMQKHGLL